MATEVLECGHAPSPHTDFTTGYGKDEQGNRLCYDCCAKRDSEFMRDNGRIALYLTDNGPGERTVTNWPGSLRFYVYHLRKGRHNIARVRYDAWFTGPDGETWHGVQYGDNTQIIHCRRLKRA